MLGHRRSIFILLLTKLLVASCLQAFAQTETSIYGRQLIFLKEMYQFGVSASMPDIPTFVLYEGGAVVYTRSDRDGPVIYSVVLTKGEVNDLVVGFAIPSSFYKLKDRYTGEGTSDLGDNILKVDLERPKEIAVYGYLGEKGRGRQNAPKEYLNLYDKLRKYKNSKANVWLPAEFEVYLESYYDYFVDSGKKTSWPKSMPDLNSPDVRFENDRYVLHVNGDKFNEFRRYYSLLDEQKAVEVNGKRMIVSYKVPFPSIQ